MSRAIVYVITVLITLMSVACQPTSQGAPTLPPSQVAEPVTTFTPPQVIPASPGVSRANAGPAQPPSQGWTRYTTADGLPSDDLLTVFAADIIATGIEQACIQSTTPLAKSVWVGSNGAGLGYWDGVRWNTVTTTTPNTRLAGNTVQSLFILPRGRVLIGTDRGLSTHCPNKEDIRWSFGILLWTPPTTSVQAISVVGSSHFYGHPNGARGMYQGSYDQLFTTGNGLGANDTRAVVGDVPTSRAWVGTSGGGVSRFTLVQRPYRINQTLNTSNSGIASDYVTSLARETTGVLWIGHAPAPDGSHPGGLSRYNENAPEATRWQVFNVANGALPSDEVRAVALDKTGDLWVATAAGLAYRAAQTGVWTHYTVENTAGGLGSNSISGISIASDNTRWFSTRGGGLTRLMGAPPPATTATPGPTQTQTAPTATVSMTMTPSQTPAHTPTLAASRTSTRTPTLAATLSPTLTASRTATGAPPSTLTLTPTMTSQPSLTATPTLPPATITATVPPTASPNPDQRLYLPLVLRNRLLQTP